MNNTETVGECLKFCQSVRAECRWFSFFPAEKDCVLSADCLAFDGSCSDFFVLVRESVKVNINVIKSP